MFPPFFGNRTLEQLDLSGNNLLVSPPRAFVESESNAMERGRAVVEYFRDLEFYGDGSLQQVNVCVLGHGASGKTSLIRSVLLDKHLFSPRACLC